jgi:hypothetical protein
VLINLYEFERKEVTMMVDKGKKELKATTSQAKRGCGCGGPLAKK